MRSNFLAITPSSTSVIMATTKITVEIRKLYGISKNNMAIAIGVRINLETVNLFGRFIFPFFILKLCIDYTRYLY